MFKLTPARRTSNGYVRPTDFDGFFEDFFPNFLTPAREQEKQWSPPVEVSEKEGVLTFQVELPGIDEKNIHINVEDGNLIFSGERSGEKIEGSETLRCERWYGKFYRSFRLPEYADTENISAELKHGLLKVSVPKKEEAKRKTIDVKIH